ncbi:MAG: hypothetical protein ACKOUS_14390, partial [Alphaproteobacteria bacterium]
DEQGSRDAHQRRDRRPEAGLRRRHAGTAGGLFFSAAEVGGAGGPIALGVLFDATGGFAAGLWMLAALAALMLLGALRLRALEARAAA